MVVVAVVVAVALVVVVVVIVVVLALCNFDDTVKPEALGENPLLLALTLP